MRSEGHAPPRLGGNELWIAGQAREPGGSEVADPLKCH